MRSGDYFELFRYLMEQRCLRQEDILFVENVREWCRVRGIPETDGERPMKLVSGDAAGCRMLIGEEIPERVVEERITAAGIRAQIKSLTLDRPAKLDTIQKKLAFLFLREFAFSLPEVQEDDLLADDWAFDEMDRLGYFKDVS